MWLLHSLTLKVFLQLNKWARVLEWRRWGCIYRPKLKIQPLPPPQLFRGRRTRQHPSAGRVRRVLSSNGSTSRYRRRTCPVPILRTRPAVRLANTLSVKCPARAGRGGPSVRHSVLQGLRTLHALDADANIRHLTSQRPAQLLKPVPLPIQILCERLRLQAISGTFCSYLVLSLISVHHT
jgi:hypothetical protein